MLHGSLSCIVDLKVIEVWGLVILCFMNHNLRFLTTSIKNNPQAVCNKVLQIGGFQLLQRREIVNINYSSWRVKQYSMIIGDLLCS